MDDLGQRIRAARAYAGISRKTLAESVQLTRGQLERLEGGLDQPVERQMSVIVKELAEAMRLPESFFTANFNNLEP